MTYQGGGSSSLPVYLLGVLAVGAGNARYDVYGCQPPPLDLNSDFTPVFSGQTVTGNLCFEIASDDAATLLLTVQGSPGPSGSPSADSVEVVVRPRRRRNGCSAVVAFLALCNTPL